MGKVRQWVTKAWDLIGGDATWHVITEIKRYFLGPRGVWHVLTLIASIIVGTYGALQAQIDSQPTYKVVTFFVLLFVGVLGIINLLWMLWDRWQRRPVTVQLETQPLQDAPYLTVEAIGRTIRYIEIGEMTKLITLQIFNGLHHSHPKAIEATGIIAELTYYDLHWHRLFGPLRGCWVSEKSTTRSSEIYLDTDPITLKGQESKNLAIALSLTESKGLFALSKESLSFYLWKNPASALAANYYLRISLKGDTVQQILYCHIHHPADSRIDFESVDSIQPPEGMY
jgi:hypothetical protein